MLMNTFFRGQGVRQGVMIVKGAVGQARSLSAGQRRVHFLVFSPPPADSKDPFAEGWMEIHIDSNEDGIYNGDYDKMTDDATDPPIDGRSIELPKGVVFETSPQWVSFQPSGYMNFASGFSEVQAAEFDMNMERSNPSEIRCDISVRINGRNFWVLCDLDRAAGKVRRHFFLQKEP